MPHKFTDDPTTPYDWAVFNLVIAGSDETLKAFLHHVAQNQDRETPFQLAMLADKMIKYAKQALADRAEGRAIFK